MGHYAHLPSKNSGFYGFFCKLHIVSIGTDSPGFGRKANNVRLKVLFLYKYLGTIKPKTQNAVVPALRAPQHFGFWV